MRSVLSWTDLLDQQKEGFMSQEERGNRSRGELEMEVIAMLRRLKVAPITITRHENAALGAEYRWTFLNLGGNDRNFIPALEEALNQAMAWLWAVVEEEIPPELPESIRANLPEWNAKLYEAKRARRLQDEREGQ
jgi:hypothetical protein